MIDYQCFAVTVAMSLLRRPTDSEILSRMSFTTSQEHASLKVRYYADQHVSASSPNNWSVNKQNLKFMGSHAQKITQGPKN